MANSSEDSKDLRVEEAIQIDAEELKTTKHTETVVKLQWSTTETVVKLQWSTTETVVKLQWSTTETSETTVEHH